MELDNKKRQFVIEAEEYVSKIIPNGSKADRDTVFSLLSHDELIEMIDEIFSDIEKIELSELKEITNNKNLLTIMIKHLTQTTKMDDLSYKPGEDKKLDKKINEIVDDPLDAYNYYVDSYPAISEEEQLELLIELQKIKQKILEIPEINMRVKNLKKALEKKLIKKSDYNQVIGEILESFEEYQTIRKIIAKKNQRLVRKIANKFARKSGYKSIEIIQICNDALLKAINGYDFKRDIKFSTYAGKCMENEIIRNLPNLSNNIKIPSQIQTLDNRISKIDNQIRNETDSGKSDFKEIAKRYCKKYPDAKEITEEDVEESIKRRTYLITVSINQPVNDHDNSTLEDIIKDTNDYEMKELYNRELNKAENDLMDSILQSREKRIIVKRFGLNGEEPQTLRDIGEEEHVKPERVRQIQNKAIRKLRNHPRTKKKLADF